VAEAQLKLTQAGGGDYLVYIIEKLRGYSDLQLPKEFISSQPLPPPFHLTLWAVIAPSNIKLMSYNLASQQKVQPLPWEL
jgi:hypothetical protein